MDFVFDVSTCDSSLTYFSGSMSPDDREGAGDAVAADDDGVFAGAVSSARAGVEMPRSVSATAMAAVIRFMMVFMR
jgi:hypothetical protein